MTYYFKLHSIIDLTELVGPLDMPGNETGSVEISGISLTGELGLWGKGLMLKDTYSDRTICASITVIIDIHKMNCLLRERYLKN